jgi:hypothetical protein
MIENYKCKFKSRNKWIFVPNDRCMRKGQRILDYFANRVDLPDYYFHYAKGGHVAALHAHLNNELFFKIDIKNFFYSISRNRVVTVLRHWHCGGSYPLAQWSCVANPYPGMSPFVLPIGFIQSPLLASLVLMRSPVANAIDRSRSNGVEISVYLDDVIGSHQRAETLRDAYEDILRACVEAKLVPNAEKLTPPSKAIIAFNCNLTKGTAEVTEERIAKFLSEERSPLAYDSFQQYRQRVASANIISPR